MNRTRTDPTAPDRDSLATGANESSDDVLDADEDLDGESLPNDREQQVGTHSLSTDGDGDGIPDDVELDLTGTDPTLVNSDSMRTTADESLNNRSDGREDFDDDGLPTVTELEIGSDPFSNDTDRDGR